MSERCTTDQLQTLDAEFRPSDSSDCGVPNVTVVDEGEQIPDHLIVYKVGACPYEAVLAELHRGQLDIKKVRRVPSSDEQGLHVATMPRPGDGTFRLVWIRAGWQGRDDPESFLRLRTTSLWCSGTYESGSGRQPVGDNHAVAV